MTWIQTHYLVCHIARTVENKNTYKILEGKSEVELKTSHTATGKLVEIPKQQGRTWL
jgi:hypothetical protein